jgi:type I restriction enzyme R subunit
VPARTHPTPRHPGTLIVFEKREQKVAKKSVATTISRRQQIVDESSPPSNPNPNAQDANIARDSSGIPKVCKSLTMVLPPLKLKTTAPSTRHLREPQYPSSHDRIDLDDQISKTFQACGLPNPPALSPCQTCTKPS